MVKSLLVVFIVMFGCYRKNDQSVKSNNQILTTQPSSINFDEHLFSYFRNILTPDVYYENTESEDSFFKLLDEFNKNCEFIVQASLISDKDKIYSESGKQITVRKYHALRVARLKGQSFRNTNEASKPWPLFLAIPELTSIRNPGSPWGDRVRVDQCNVRKFIVDVNWCYRDGFDEGPFRRCE